jgi:hypothetical protein
MIMHPYWEVRSSEELASALPQGRIAPVGIRKVFSGQGGEDLSIT